MIDNNKIHLLLIEDNPADVRIIEEYLKKDNDFSYKLDTRGNLSEGLQLLERDDFNIILLDLALPDSENREDTLKKVLDTARGIPIIIFTGLDDKELALDALKKGAQDYLVKGELSSGSLTRAILFAIERYEIENKKVGRKVQVFPLDNKDKEILNILQENYRISYQELHEKIGLAASTIHNRIRKMKESGVIREFDTIIDPFKIGYETMAILGISVDPLKLDEIAEKIASYEEVQLVATSTGDHDIIVRVIKRNEKELWRFINENIKTIPSVKPQMDVSSFIDIFKMTHKINFKIE